MTGWKRTALDGRNTVKWRPGDSQAALDALVSVDGTGIDSESDLPDDGLVDLDGQPDMQQAVREQFDDLTTDTSGGSTGGQ
jgi:hypothetical protein